MHSLPSAAFRARYISSIILLLVMASPVQALPVIQELYYDQPGRDGAGVFTELYGTPGFNLNGWTLQGVNGSTGAVYRQIDLTGNWIPNDGIFVISTSAADSALALLSDLVANVDWQNGSDALLLVDNHNVVVDALQYGELPGFSVGEGTAAIDVSPGQSLSRRYAGLDSDDNGADFIALSAPTPGSAIPFPGTPQQSPIALALPSSAALLLLGIPALFRVRRLS